VGKISLCFFKLTSAELIVTNHLAWKVTLCLKMLQLINGATRYYICVGKFRTRFCFTHSV